MDLNATHDASRKSWVESANAPGCDFPLQNLPFGVFHRKDEASRIGVAIGDRVLDLAACLRSGLLQSDAAEACAQPSLNALMALGPGYCAGLREQMFSLLAEGAPESSWVAKFLVPLDDAIMELPCRIGDYTDFYASIHHATNVGRMFRPEHPLLPNYKHLPVAYHGRASSLVASGAEIVRPHGEIKAAAEAAPVFAPTQQLDYEMELGFFVGPGNEPGERIALENAEQHIFGVCLLNDWSARDIQAWEYQPLGPFLAKNFATTISPWVVTMDALAPFRVPAARPESDPALLPHLFSQQDRGGGGFAVELEVSLRSERMRQSGEQPQRLSRGNFCDMYWTPAQMLTHHASNGCNLRPGDLLGSGTVSGPTPESRGCLLEITERGQSPITLASGEQRSFLADGDGVLFRGMCQREGFAAIGFGRCDGRVVAAR